MKLTKSIVKLCSAVTVCLLFALPAVATEVDIPYTKFKLDNGLTVIVHEDHKAPIVAVNIWYHVGSKDEKPGKTGFAHLFEHLMFNGSENYPGEFFEPLEKVGATGMNGTTNPDRTNYYETVPSTAVDLALWMESDRMGHLLGVIDQAKLDEQRGVVQNEKRQGENRPYGKARTIIAENSYPPEHPYSWTTIGSMDDLNAASLEDVNGWFKSYYGAANAVLVLAGDITVDKAKQLAKKYFADIAAGPAIERKKAWIAKRSGEKRVVLEDDVPQDRLYLMWNVPEAGNVDADLLDLAADVLGGGKNSRFYKRLVYQDRIATSVSVYNSSRELGGRFSIIANIVPGVALETVEKVINEELVRFLEKGVTKKELKRIKAGYRASFIRGVERVSGKASILATNEVFLGDPSAYQTTIDRLESASAKEIQSAARQWLSDGRLVLEYRIKPKYKQAKSAIDRSKGLPEVTQMPDLSFPDLQRATLSNGIQVVLAERHAVPVVRVELQLDAGYAADHGGKTGTSSFTMAMLDEGTRSLDALEISARKEELGAGISSGSTLDSSSIGLNAITENIDESLALYADIILNPAFDQKEIERLRAQWLTGIKREKARPRSMVFRTVPPLLYGKEHAYSMPLTGSGTTASIKSLTRDDLVAFHKTWFRPDNAVMVVVGDTTLKEILPKLEDEFGDWKKPKKALPVKSISQVSFPDKSRVFLIDKPRAKQSVIVAAQLAPATGSGNEFAVSMMNKIIGGKFTSRINLNLREDKHWSYGARTLSMPAKGQRPYMVYAPVQTDKTKESVQEIIKEFYQYIGNRPATQKELSVTTMDTVRGLPGRYETAASVAGAISSIVKYSRPDNYIQTYKQNVEGLTLKEVRQTAKEILKPSVFTWVIVGDLSKIEKGIRQLNIGKVTILNNDGHKIR